MTKPFKELRNIMSSNAQMRSQAKTNFMLKEMLLNEIRQAKAVSQEKLAEELCISNQACQK